MSDVDAAFEEMVRYFQHHSDLAAAFRQAEQHYAKTHPQGGYTNIEVVRHAWMKLTPEQQGAEMGILFNCFWYQMMANRRWLELDAKAPDANTYLHHGDLEILEYIGEAIEDGFTSIEYEQLHRLISEIELLQHRLKMRAVEGGDRP